VDPYWARSTGLFANHDKLGPISQRRAGDAPRHPFLPIPVLAHLRREAIESVASMPQIRRVAHEVSHDLPGF
jgi:hypothetical protein